MTYPVHKNPRNDLIELCINVITMLKSYDISSRFNNNARSHTLVIDNIHSNTHKAFQHLTNNILYEYVDQNSRPEITRNSAQNVRNFAKNIRNSVKSSMHYNTGCLHATSVSMQQHS